MTQMKKIRFSTTINAPRQKVWDTMLQDDTYRRWTRAFNPLGSWYEGGWTTGSTIRFLGPDKDGTTGGMVSRIREHRLYEHVSIEHVGVIHDGKEDTTSDAVKKWTPAFENYTLTDRNGVTEVLVEMDVHPDHQHMFDNTWPQALANLKELAEANEPAPARG